MTYSSEVLADSPLGYWRLGDPAASGTSLTATASSNNGTQNAAAALDNNPDTYWTTDATTTGWWQVQFPAATVLTKYAILRRDDLPTINPNSWTFQGSNDGSTWTVLDTQSGITWPNPGEIKAFAFANSTAFTYYRINITANNGHGSHLSFAEFYTNADYIAADSSGNTRSGAYFGTPTRGATGLLTGDTDTATTFSGAAPQCVRVAYASWMVVSAVTVEALIQTTGTGVMPILDRDDGVNRAFQFRLNAGQLEFITIGGGAGVVTATSPGTVNNGVKHHVAATYDASNIRLYVDGTLVLTQAAVGVLSTSPSALAIGKNLANSAYFGGTIDEAAYYGTALSGARIAAHAAQMSSPTIVTPTTTGTSPVAVGSSSRTVGVGATTGTSPVGIATSSSTVAVGATPTTTSLAPVGVGSSSASLLVMPAVTTGLAPVGVATSSATALVPVTTTTGAAPITVPTSARTFTVTASGSVDLLGGSALTVSTITLVTLIPMTDVTLTGGSTVSASTSVPVVEIPGVTLGGGGGAIARPAVPPATDARTGADQWRYVVTDLQGVPLGELVDIEHDPVEEGVNEMATMSLTMAMDDPARALIRPSERQCQVWQGNALLLRGPFDAGRASEDGTTMTYTVNDPSWWWRNGGALIGRTPSINLLYNGDFNLGLAGWTPGYDKDSIPATNPAVQVVADTFTGPSGHAAEITGVESVTQTSSELSSNAVFWPNLATFRPGGVASVEAVANAMPTTAGLAVSVVGHTANDGTGNGLELSLRRAQAAAEIIRGKRPSAVVSTRGVGFYDPKPGFPIDSQAQRRVVISYSSTTTVSAKAKQWIRQTVEVTQPKSAAYGLELAAAVRLKVTDSWSVEDANMVSLRLVARRKPEPVKPWDERQGVSEVSISDTDPVNRWISANTSVTIPADGRPYLVDVYLYAPAALARYTRAVLEPQEMLYFWGVDQALIVKGLIEHMQDPITKMGRVWPITVGTRTPLTGVERDKSYPFSGRMPIETAIDDLMSLYNGLDVDVPPHQTDTTVCTYWPHQGQVVDYQLVQGGNVVQAVPATTNDVGSLIIAQSQDSSTVRDEAYALDARAFGGMIRQRLITAEQDTPLSELDETAGAELAWAKVTTPAYWVDVDPQSVLEVMANVGKGDTVRLLLDFPQQVDALARVVKRQIHPSGLRLMVSLQEV